MGQVSQIAQEKSNRTAMILKKRIPKDFYKLFRTQNMDYYMMFLVAIYEENNEVYASLGLTVGECRAIVSETIARAQIVWADEINEETDDKANQENNPEINKEEIEEKNDRDSETDAAFTGASPSGIIARLISWGWLKSDYDEKLNTDIISFPEYSQLYVELFQKLQSEDDSRERESILSIYSALFTYHTDQEKNNDILKNALRTSKSLGQLLSNIQDGMRTYFDELSGKKNFIGIQEVLIDEINNSDSKKYAILTTTDSFYRYKEAVKELISQILNDNEQKKAALQVKQAGLEKDSVPFVRNEHAILFCEEASQVVCQVEREFDLIERKYNKLIEQKSTFAKRALARIHYILQEGNHEEDPIIPLINLLDRSPKSGEILEELRNRMRFTTQYRMITDSSFYNRRDKNETEFHPIAVKEEQTAAAQDMADFVPKPLYTKKQLMDFKKKNMQNGTFVTTDQTVQSAEDLEKLLLIWQDATESRIEEDRVALGEELQSETGFTFTKLTVNELRFMEDKNA